MHLMALIVCTLMGCSSCKPNVLFLVSDDMRPQLGSYEGPDFPSPVHPRMHTPNLDSLASRSFLLKRAYVQQALCGPSRTSLLTGRRPDTTHVYNCRKYWRKVGGNFTTLPQYFKQHGYQTIGMGKIFHSGKSSGYDDPVSWSKPYYHAPNLDYWNTKQRSWEAVSPSTELEVPLPDNQVADQAIKTLREVAPAVKSGEQPFFLAVGFYKPHLPFVFPERFLDHYPKKDISLPPNPYAPVDMPPIAWWKHGGLRNYQDILPLHASGNINTTLPDQLVKDLRRAYYSAVTYIDSLIGQVLSELDTLGLRSSTIVSFWGDHGWQLGEHGEWTKQTNFELAVHAPMMISIPGVTDDGMSTDHVTEFIDLFPTLVDAAGLPPLPPCPADSSTISTCREGDSLMPLINDPSAEWEDNALSQYPRKDETIMGYSIRTTRWRYTEWVKFIGKPHYRPDWDSQIGAELYDHVFDPQENTNLAKQPLYASIVRTLSSRLHYKVKGV